MSTAFRTVALVGKYQSPDVAESVQILADFLHKRGLDVLIEVDTASSIGARGFAVADYDAIGARADFAVIVGGDGTMLNTARRLAHYDVPLVGVNEGRLGFMTDIAREHMIERIGEMLDGRYRREYRHLLEAEVQRDGARVFHNLALNDIVLNKGDLGSMIEFELKIDGEFIYTQRSDGLIICTPTGSTAYALSANGPILHPAVAGVALVPLCPHALTNRPISIPDSSRIEIALLPPHQARVHFDGHTRCDLRSGDCVQIVRSRHTVCLLHPEGYSYFAMLRQKLHWSESPRHSSPR